MLGDKIYFWKEGAQRIRLGGVFDRWLWGDTPAGFARLSCGRRRVMLVRRGLEGELLPEKVLTRRSPAEEAVSFQGRGALYILRLGDGQNALVRRYRHGGWLRRLTGDYFFTWPPRPFKELSMIEEAARRGVPTLEVLGACVERVWGPFYRGWLVTRELREGHDLWAALQNRLYGSGSTDSIFRAVAKSIRRMHRRGICHGDLNLKNILVRLEENEFRSYVIDLDKATLFSSGTPLRKARKNLDRLLRSARKLDPGRRFLSPETWSRFLELYWKAPDE